MSFNPANLQLQREAIGIQKYKFIQFKTPKTLFGKFHSLVLEELTYLKTDFNQTIFLF